METESPAAAAPDVRSAPPERDATPDQSAQRPDRASARGARKGSSGAGGASPLALIEEVFPGRVMEFTPAATPTGRDASEPDGDGADPDSFPADSEDADD